MIDKYTLVTTPVEETWPSINENILFLGEWCKLYSRKKKWKQYKFKVVKYHWNNREKYNNDYFFINSIYEDTLIALSYYLNQYHKESNNTKYWRIICGPWLGYFMHIIFDRWSCLKEAYKNQNIEKVICLKNDYKYIVSNDFSHFSKIDIHDDIWNELLISEIIKTKEQNFEIKTKNLKLEKELEYKNLKSDKNFYRNTKKEIKNIILLINHFRSKYDNYFINYPCINRYKNFSLQLNLGQFPRYWEKQEVPLINLNLEDRNWKLDLDKDYNYTDLNEFRDLIKVLIPKFIPKSYFEGYKFLKGEKFTKDWPIKPKCIFTSGGILGDDIFKIWLAQKVQIGSKFLIGQHGGAYGLSKISFVEDHQVKVSNQFITWGWERPDFKNLQKFGVLNDLKSNIKYNSNGKMIVLQNAFPRYGHHMISFVQSAIQWEKYFEFQCNFLAKLPNHIIEDTVIRIYPKADYKYNQIQRWQEKFNNIEIDYCKKTLDKSIQNKRLCISTSNTTTMLLTLSWNIPTIILWEPKYWELNKYAKVDLENLKNVGIFHESEFSASEHIKNYWQDINLWWLNKKTQEARIKFCNKYANIKKELAKDLSNLIKKN